MVWFIREMVGQLECKGNNGEEFVTEPGLQNNLD